MQGKNIAILIGIGFFAIVAVIGSVFAASDNDTIAAGRGIDPPSITRIVPRFGVNTGTVVITDLHGTNFQAGATVMLRKTEGFTVSEGSTISATNVKIVSPAKITCKLDLKNARPGWWNVIVTNPGGRSDELEKGFFVYQESKTTRVVVRSVPAGAKVFMDGDQVGLSNLSMRIPLGDHTVSVRKTGYLMWKKTVKLTDPDNTARILARLVVNPCTLDSDRDGTPDCRDRCPVDSHKTAPGTCGCGVPDTDTDGDLTPDCKDRCPADVNKIAPGTCGCGVPDTDTDGDLTPDCNDLCPDDVNKITPGTCGCGVPDTDSDRDGTPDCNDL
ncbi:MAG: PEGA domain-containing protein, partial [Methanoregulaceae archaeon]|nr:PEGA domain-containing protein [Methanoregulaceae archaeon]